MTREKCFDLLDRYDRFLGSIGPKKKDQEMVEHLLGMLPKMRAMLVSFREYPGHYEKFMRWLGFIQGVLWHRRWFTLDELKEHNRP